MPIYSHSKLSTFEQCPYKYKLAYIDRVISEEDTIEAFLGSRIHETFEKLYKDLKFQKLNLLKDLLKFFNDQWKKNWHENIKIVKKNYNEENYRKMGEKFITDFYNKHKPFDKDKTIAIEDKIFIKLDKDGNYQITGYIDRLSEEEPGVYVINDYKTSNSLPKQEHLDHDRQLALYAIAVKEKYSDIKDIKLVWHFLAFDKSFGSKRTDKQFEELKKQTLELIKQIENEAEFKTKKSALCDYCVYTNLCPEFKHEVSLEKKEANEFLQDSGVKLVNEYAKVKSLQKEAEEKERKLKEALIEFAEKEGVNVIVGSDNKVSIKEYDKIIIPEDKKEKLIRLLKEKGLYEELSFYNYFKLSSKILNKEIDEDIINLTERERAYRLSLRKIKREELKILVIL